MEENLKIEDILVKLFAKHELSHISIWTESGVWYVMKKKPFFEERLFYGTSLVDTLQKCL